MEAFLELYTAMERPGSRAAPATVEHGVGPTTAGGADALTAPRPRTSRGESGSQRTLSRMLVFAVLGSASGVATVEEQLEHTLATGVRSRRCVCATRSVLTSWCMRPHTARGRDLCLGRAHARLWDGVGKSDGPGEADAR